MTNATAIITAAIIADGADSMAPEHADAVDALIALDGEHLCCVTLIGGEVWGSVHHWCDRPNALERDDLERDELIAAIEEAVQDAMRSTQPTSTVAQASVEITRHAGAL
jgi:hypothetical protein